MSENKPLPDRRSIRLKHYDYSLPGFYFITICIKDRKCEFGEIIDGEMHLNTGGQIAQTIWERLPQHFFAVELDAFVIMPNHIHGILELTNLPEEPFSRSLIPVRSQEHMREVKKKTGPKLGKIVRHFKSAVTYKLHKVGNIDFEWQRNYYESIIRNAQALANIRYYIANNPASWAQDSLSS